MNPVRSAGLIVVVLVTTACATSPTSPPPSTAAASSTATAMPPRATPSATPPAPSDARTDEPSETTLSLPSGYAVTAAWKRVAGTPEFHGAAINDVVAAGPGFVAGGSIGGASGEPRRPAIWTSTDGLSWSLVPEGVAFTDRFPTYVGLPGVGGIVGMAVGNGRMVAVGVVGSGYGEGDMHAVFWTSVDGLTWTTSVAPSVAHAAALDVAFGSSGFVAVGVRCAGCVVAEGSTPPAGSISGAVWRSTDGVNWEFVGGQTFARWVPSVVVWSGNHYVGMGGDVASLAECSNCFGSGNGWFSSSDGSQWAVKKRPLDLPGPLVGSDEGAYFGNGVSVTDDGFHWRATGQTAPPDDSDLVLFLPSPTVRLAIGGLSIAGGATTAVAFLSSANGRTWQRELAIIPPVDRDRGDTLAAIASSGTTTVIVGWYGTGPGEDDTVLEGQVFTKGP